MNNLVENKKALSRIWNLLSALFCQPEEDLHGNKEVYNELVRSLQIIEDEITSDVKSLLNHYESAGQQSVLIEYTRLFIGPFKTVAPPYSSVYLSKDGTVFGDETQQVLDFYHQSGVEFDFSINELPDHIAVELEFMHYLSSHEINEIESGNIEKAEVLFNSYKIFLNKHMKRWAPMFCDRIISGANNDYYRTLAICFKSFVESQADQS